ncbi:MAG: GGDEF domain-containing protein [Nitrospiraceae bacterium]
MPLTFRTTLVAFMFPGGILVLAALAFLRPTGLPHWVQPLLHLLPFGVMLFSGLFAWLFDRARVALTLLILLLTDLVLLGVTGSVSADGHPDISWEVLYQAAGLLVPLNLLGLTIYSKDRIRSTRTMVWVVGILVQATIVLGLRQLAPLEFVAVLHTAFLPAHWTAWSPLSQPGLLAFVLSTGLLVFRFMESRSPLETGFAWTLVATAFAFFSIRWQWDPRGFLMTAALAVTTTLVIASYRAAHRDELTGLPDREALAQATQRLGQTYAVALLEVDQLRQVNNLYGRRVGDQIMAHAARKVVHSSGIGKVFLYNQDQFLVLFPRKTTSDTLVSLESMRKAVSSLDLVLRHRAQIVVRPKDTTPEEGTEESIPVTLSLGVAGTGELHVRWELVVKNACGALLQAKQDGGNLVRRSGPQERAAIETGPARIRPSTGAWPRTGTE